MRRLRTALSLAAAAALMSIPVALAAGATQAPPAAASGSPVSSTSATPPAATTGSATAVGQSSATVQGTVNPGGQATTYYFQYGTTASYGSQTASQNAGSGNTAAPVTANLTGLSSSTTYHYRLVAVNASGTSLGADQTFQTTTPPAVSTGMASSVNAYSMVLNGTTNPEGQATTYWFQYGTTTAYGQQTGPANAGSGSSAISVHAYVGGLATNTYHYRLVAQNAGGTSYGADKTATVGGSHVVLMAHMGFVSPGRAIGVGVGCFGGDTPCVGHVTISHGGTVIGQRDFNVAADSGGFQDMELSMLGAQMLKGNGVWHLLPVTVTATTSSGQKVTNVISLARWVWH